MTDSTRSPLPKPGRGERRRAAVIDAVIGGLEDLLYVVIAAVLGVTAVALIVVVARGVPSMFGASGDDQVVAVLDAVLLVFIVVELLFAVRETVARRELVAEPFLIVGIIASIKEVVVVSVKAADAAGEGDVFADELRLVGVLGVLVLVFAASAFLLRRKEREPDEGRQADAEPAAS